ncbi:MAG: MFS transporter, partial [Burkholderiaceae bacterium]
AGTLRLELSSLVRGRATGAESGSDQIVDEFRDPRPISGRRVVAASFALAVFAWGLGFYGLSVYTQFLGDDGRWSLGSLSLATTLSFVAGSLSIGLVDRLAGRHGRRRVAAAGIVALAGGVASLPHLPWPPLLFAAYVIMAFGWAATSGTAITQIVGTWFEARRGLALSLALTGASVGGFTVVPAMVWAIAGLGVGPGRGLAALVCGLLALVAVALLVDRPTGGPRAPSPAAASVSLPAAPVSLPAAPVSAAAAAPASAAAAPAVASPPPSAASRPLWTVMTIVTLSWFAQVAFLSQQVPLLAPRIGAQPAAVAVAITTVAALAGRLLLGLAVDRLDHRRITAACLALQVMGMAMLWVGEGRAALFVGCLLFGVSVGNLITLPAIFVQREFDASGYAATVSRIWAVGQFFYAFAPITAGLLIDVMARPAAVLLGCAALEAIAAALCLVRRSGSG